VGGGPGRTGRDGRRSSKPIAQTIRGEHISIDTIPLVGEAATIRAAASAPAGRLPRVKAIVMAGYADGRDMRERGAAEVRAQGLLVVSLIWRAASRCGLNLVVTDPVQAGVMTVMAVADTRKIQASGV